MFTCYKFRVVEGPRIRVEGPVRVYQVGLGGPSAEPYLKNQHGRDEMSTRRNFLTKGILALAGGLLGGKALAEDKSTEPQTMEASGEVLKSHMMRGRPPVEPLDTMVLWERSDNNTERPMTHEVLSLIHEEKGNRSFPWTIYSHLTTSHVEGDACVMCSRLTKLGAGWSSGLHSEVFAHARGVALGVNVEMSNHYTGTESTQIYGLNLLAAHGEACDMAIHIHDGNSHWKKAIGIEGKGEAAIDIAGKYDVGVALHSNSIRLDEGACIELDGTGKVRMRYKAGRIEFLNGDKCVGHIDVSERDHAL